MMQALVSSRATHHSLPSHVAHRASQPRRFSTAVRAQADRPGPSSNRASEPESDFDRETGRLALRMLTARAAAVVLQNISQVDTFKATWLQDYCKLHPPIEGNAFLASLMEAKPVCSVDPYTGATQVINPAAIASAVLSTREVLAKQLAKNLTSHVQDANVTLMRTHLETHTYVSGTNDEVKPSFRQYRSRKEQRHQLL